jgi:HK97 family phage major capsid protein
MTALMRQIENKRAEREKALVDARDVAAKAETEKRATMTADERVMFDKCMELHKKLTDEVNELEGDLKRQRQLADLEDRSRESRGRTTNPTEPERRGTGGERGREHPGGDRPTVRRWKLKSGEVRRMVMRGHRASPEYRAAYRTYLLSGRASGVLDVADAPQHRSDWGGDDVETRDIVADVDTSGGYLVAPMQMQAGLIKALDDLVFVRQFATVITVTQAQSLGEASLDADPDDGEWTGELTTGTFDTAMKFGRRELNPTLCSKGIAISRKMLRLNPSAESFILDRLAYKFAITQEKNFLLGDGANKPLGLFVASNAGVPTSRDVVCGGTTAFTADGLIAMKYALKAAYRSRARWMIHRNGMEQIAKLKDGNGQYLWRQGLTAGEPDVILQLPVAESEYVPNTFTTGQYVAMLADYSFYHIADAATFSVQRLVETAAKQNKVEFIGRLECDGMPVLAEAFVRGKLG